VNVSYTTLVKLLRIDISNSCNVVLYLVIHSVFSKCFQVSRYNDAAFSQAYRPRPIQGGPKKRGLRLMTTILSNLKRFFQKITGRFIAESLLKKLKSVNIWQSYKQERDCVMHFLCLLGLAVCWLGAQSA